MQLYKSRLPSRKEMSSVHPPLHLIHVETSRDTLKRIKSKKLYISLLLRRSSSLSNIENSNIEYTSSESVKMSSPQIDIDSSSSMSINISYTAHTAHSRSISITDTTESSPHCNNFSNSTTETRPQWFGIQLAKQQSWQEQRVFANHQLVRFNSASSSESSFDNSTTNDDDDDEEVITQPKEVTTDSRPSWRFSNLAKQFSKLEQECFANSFTKVKVNVQGQEKMGDENGEWRFVDLARQWERLEQRAFASSLEMR